MATVDTTGFGNPSEGVRQEQAKEMARRRAASRLTRRSRPSIRRVTPVPPVEVEEETTAPVEEPQEPQEEPQEEPQVPQPEAQEPVSEETPESTQESETPQGESGDPEEPQEIERPSDLFGSEAAWRDYRLANGYTEEEVEGLGRNALRDLPDR